MIAQMMAAVSTSEASFDFFQTIRRNIPEDSHLHTRHRENLKSHHAAFLISGHLKSKQDIFGQKKL
jgi:hypothetical protein